MLERYSAVLGVSISGSVSDIRKAYKQKAKLWHPDINKSQDAHEKFLLLREAYEYLIDLKSGKKSEASEPVHAWSDERTSEARARAAEYARMRYAEFRKSDYSKGGEALEVIADHINLLFSFVLSAVILSVMTVAIGPLGFLLGLVIAAILLFFSYHGVSGGVDLKKLLQSFGVIFSHKLFKGILFFVCNISIIFLVGFQTLIALQTLLYIYLSAIVLMLVLLLFVFKIRSGFNLRFYPIGVATFVVNVVLLINYLFSSNPTQESYRFVKGKQYVLGSRHMRGGIQESTFISLKGHKYKEFEGIRIFINYDELREKNLITYTFEDGFLGLRVMKSYELFQVLFHGDGSEEILE